MRDAAVLLAYDPEKVKPGWIAFFVVMILVVATFLLWRSMNTQLGKIQVPPDGSTDSDEATRSGSNAGSGSASGSGSDAGPQTVGGPDPAEESAPPDDLPDQPEDL